MSVFSDTVVWDFVLYFFPGIGCVKMDLVFRSAVSEVLVEEFVLVGVIL